MSASVTATTTDVACAHCGLPVPESLRRPEGEESYCCHGCEAARGAILACGLENYYKLRDGDGEQVPEASDGLAVFDRESFRERHVTALPGGFERAEVRLEGVHCVACMWLLERLPKVVDGLVSLELDYGRALATLVWNPVETSLSSIASQLARFGYPAHPVEVSAERKARRKGEHKRLAEIGVAAACMGNVMLLAFALYSGDIEPGLEGYFRWLSAGLGVLSVAWPGRVFFRGAWAAIRTRSWHLDMPVALALGVGSLGGLINVVRGTGEIYFDSITMLVLFLLIGRWLQSRQQDRAREAVELLFATTPPVVRKVDEADGSVEEVAADEVVGGDLVEVLGEACVPVDGVIEEGESSFDESALTGESAPVVRVVGDEVAAGTTNVYSAVRVRVTASGRATRIGRVMNVIDKMSRSRVPVVGSADRMAKPFVLAVVVLATVCMVLHAVVLGAGLEMAIEHTVALLIVVCPCAVAIATPLATSIAIARLASRGILVKGGDVLEGLAGSPSVVLDKTGTLTSGRFAVESWDGDAEMRAVAAGLEANNSHPVGRALAGLAEPAVVANVRTHTGLGVSGVWHGEEVAVGSERFMRSLGVTLDRFGVQGGRSGEVFVARSGRVVARASIRDDILPDAGPAIDRLRSWGWRASIASGDGEGPVERGEERFGHRAGAGADEPG